MARLLDPFRLLLTSLAGWMNQRQSQTIDYLREENRVLREQLGGRRIRLTVQISTDLISAGCKIDQ